MSEWSDTQLSAVAEIKISNVDKKSKPGELPVHLCNYMDVYSNDYIRADIAFMKSTASSVEIEKFRVLKNDVLITKDSETPFDIGIPAVIYDEIDGLVCGYHLALLRPKADIANPVYLSKVLASHVTQAYFARVAAGSTRYGLSNGAIARTPIRLPSIERQTKIANVLQTIDEAIEQTEALIEKYSLVKAGMMHDLFTRGLTAEGKLRPPREEAPDLYKETPIGWIPKEWNNKPLGDLTTKIVDGVHHTPNYVENGVPFVTVKNLTGSSTIDFTNLNYLDEQTHRACYARADPKPGDVLVTKDGTLGTCRIVSSEMPEFSIFVSVALLRVTQELKAEWLHFFFDSGLYLKQLGYLSAGSGLQHIHLEHFRKFQIALPSLPEQQSLNEKTKILERKLESERALLAKLRIQKSGLMHDLLTGEVSVTVDDTEVAHV